MKTNTEELFFQLTHITSFLLERIKDIRYLASSLSDGALEVAGISEEKLKLQRLSLIALAQDSDHTAKELVRIHEELKLIADEQTKP